MLMLVARCTDRYLGRHSTTPRQLPGIHIEEDGAELTKAYRDQGYMHLKNK